MNTDTTPPAEQTPKQKAQKLLNDYAVKIAALNEAIAPHQAEITIRQASINEAAAPIQAEIDALEKELKKLALDQGAEIFGPESRSLTENGYILQLHGTDSVQCEDEEAAIRELQHLSRTAKTPEAQMAALACLRTKTELNKDYIATHYEGHEDWFGIFGLAVVTKDSASIRMQPKPKVKPAKKITVKKKGHHAAETQPTEVAA